MFPDGRGIGGRSSCFSLIPRPGVQRLPSLVHSCLDASATGSEMTDDTQTRCAGFPWKGWLLLLALVGFAIFRSHLGTRLDSFTLDEPYHIVAGTSYVRTGDFRLNPEHPPLMKLWLGASMPDSFKLRPFRALNEKVEERDFTEETVFYDNDAAAAQARTRA